MGTFHHGKGELHGITVVVMTRSAQVWIGRCDTITAGAVVLVGADVHTAHEDGASRDEWLRRAAMVGIHPRHSRVVLRRDDVLGIERLAEIST
jgi:hypothetical protein